MLPYADFPNYIPNWWLVVLLILTASFLQILSNVSNELGDFKNGTDTTEKRVGPHYSLAEGILQEKDFKIMIISYVILSVICGLGAIYLAFGSFFCLDSIVFILGGFVAIKAATSYSLGLDNYGRKGLGDLYVFIFFGLVAVLGSYIMVAKTLPGWHIILPACTVGLFNVAVLNINNMRDMDSDQLTRNTIPVRIGERYSKIYHFALVLIAWACMLGFSLFLSNRYQLHSIYNYLYVFSSPLFIAGLVLVFTRDHKKLDSCLPLMVVSTACFCILAAIGYILL